MKQTKGFASLAIIIGIAAILLAGVAYYGYKTQPQLGSVSPQTQLSDTIFSLSATLVIGLKLR